LISRFGESAARQAVIGASILGVIVVLSAGALWRRTRPKPASEV
jgi:hypothetical protein